MSGLDIAFFGSSLLSAYWNGAATYYRGLIRALSRRGHRVTFYEPDVLGRQQHRDIPFPEWAQVVVYSADRLDDLEGHLERAAASCDILIKASGVGVFDAYLEAAIAALRSPRTMAVFWDVDAPATLERVARDPFDRFRVLIPHYDAIFTYGGGPPVVEAYQALGCRACHPIYNALDPDTHYPVAARPEFEADLAFLGNRLPDREERVEEFFLRAAAALTDRRFLLGGNGWGDRLVPSNVSVLGHVYTRDHNAFYSSPLAVLNVNRESMARVGHSPPTRVFEAAGAGACLVTDRWAGIERFLEPDREVLVAEYGADVVHHVRELDRARARRIGEAARRRVLAEHTYDHRAAEVETILGAYPVGARRA